MDNDQHHRRARWPILSHSSVDRERNDRLGRIQWQLPEHGRQILRAIWSDANTNSHSNADSNSDIHADAYPDSHAYDHTYGVAHTDAYVNGVTKSYSHAEACTDTEAAPDSATSPVGSE